MPVYINGRFLSQRTTGVQRYATEIVRALDGLLCEGSASAGSFVLLSPRGVLQPDWLGKIECRTVGVLQGQAWEQLELPRYTRDGICLNLGNTAPLIGRPGIVVIHDAGVFAAPHTYSRTFEVWYRFLHPRLARRSLHLVTVSNFSRVELGHHLGVDLDTISIIPNGGEHILLPSPDTRVLHQLRLSRRYILAVGSESPHKNLGGVLSAVEQLARDDVDLVLAGGTNPRIFRPSRHQGGSARHAGYVTDAELRALYENAACFVYPSLYEGFGLPPLEAMTCGCPVVASRAASLPEVCGEAALYCDPADPHDIASRIQTVLEDARCSAELRRRGTERAAKFTWKNAARSLLALVGDQDHR